MPPGVVEVDPARALGRMSEWPKNRPTNFAVKCFVHGTSRCKGVWPKSRAPPPDQLELWAQRGPQLTLAEHLECLPA